MASVLILQTPWGDKFDRRHDEGRWDSEEERRGEDNPYWRMGLPHLAGGDLTWWAHREDWKRWK